MLDIHSKDGRAELCHEGICRYPQKYYLADVFKEVLDFLNQNKTEIVTLLFEDYVKSPSMIQAEIDKVPGLSAVLYKGSTSTWPAIKTMITNNTRLVIFTDSSASATTGVHYYRTFTMENYWSMGVRGSTNDSCPSRWDSGTHITSKPLFVFNHFYDVPLQGAGGAVLDNKYSFIMDRIEKKCCPLTGKKLPNFIAVDHSHEGSDGGALAVANELNRRRLAETGCP
jgi:hypothetical protein